MARASQRSFSLWRAAALAALVLGASAPARAQFFPFWGQPERARPVERALSPGQVRAVLAQEGARMVGRPRLRGEDIVAYGLDAGGNRKRFTLDAVTGEVLDVTVIARREDRPPPGDLAPQAEPLPPPVAEPLPAPAQPAPAEAKAVPPAAPAGSGGAKTAPPADPADSALSPIRPIRPAGAPKVEPLPQ